MKSEIIDRPIQTRQRFQEDEKPVHIVYWFFFLSARWKGLEQGGGAQRRKQSAQCNNDDRSLRLKQGGVVGAAF